MFLSHHSVTRVDNILKHVLVKWMDSHLALKYCVIYTNVVDSSSKLGLVNVDQEDGVPRLLQAR